MDNKKKSDEQRVKETSNETFYERLDRIERENRIARLLRNRPENLHDYQGCANAAASRLPKAGVCDVCKQPLEFPAADDPAFAGDKPNTPENTLLLRWNRAAANIGGICGSEFVDDPERVFTRVRENREALMQSLRAAKVSSPVVAGRESETRIVLEQLLTASERMLISVCMSCSSKEDQSGHGDIYDALKAAIRLAQPLIKDVRGKE